MSLLVRTQEIGNIRSRHAVIIGFRSEGREFESNPNTLRYMLK